MFGKEMHRKLFSSTNLIIARGILNSNERVYQVSWQYNESQSDDDASKLAKIVTFCIFVNFKLNWVRPQFQLLNYPYYMHNLEMWKVYYCMVLLC